MAAGNEPGETTGAPRETGSGSDLERRRRELDATLSVRRPDFPAEDGGSKSHGTAGFGNALKLSSEFIAAIAVGVALGWVIDKWAGTSPFGLIIFLLLGFGAGVLNVMRAAGLVADAGIRSADDEPKK